MENKVKGLQKGLPVNKVPLTTKFSVTVRYPFIKVETGYKPPFEKEAHGIKNRNLTLRRKSALMKGEVWS